MPTRLSAVFALPSAERARLSRRALQLPSPMISWRSFVLLMQVRGQKISPASRCSPRSLRLSCQRRLRAQGPQSDPFVALAPSLPPPGIASFASWLKWLPSSSRAERRRRFDPGFAVPPCWPFRQTQWIPSSDGHRGALSRQLRFIPWTGAHATFSSPRRAHA